MKKKRLRRDYLMDRSNAMETSQRLVICKTAETVRDTTFDDPKKKK